jgi:hypothetical protein
VANRGDALRRELPDKPRGRRSPFLLAFKIRRPCHAFRETTRDGTTFRADDKRSTRLVIRAKGQRFAPNDVSFPFRGPGSSQMHTVAVVAR